MKTLINHIKINLRRPACLVIPVILMVILSMVSCQKNEIVIPEAEDTPLILSLSAETLVLNQKEADKEFVFSWTSGSNYGTGAAISYTLQIDEPGNNFSDPVVFDAGKASYSKSYAYAELNELLLDRWSFEPGVEASLEARVIAVITSPEVEPDTTATASLNVTAYKPVTEQLFMFGSATEVGWDIANAIELEPTTSDPTVFKFQGPLAAGTFKFPVNRQSDFGQDMYMKDAEDTTKIYLHTGGDPDDSQWEITEPGQYIIFVSLLDLTISFERLQGPAYNELYIVGDATPVGWDIANAMPLVQNPDNLYQFIYDGILVPGNFKFPVNRQTDWAQDMFMKDTEDTTKIYLHTGGDPDDSQWTISEKGWYRLVLDLYKMTLSIEKLELYIVGSATPIGWNIGDAIQLEQDAGYPYIFTYNGELLEGEFKCPVDRSTDWSQDMYMADPDDPTKMYRHRGGADDDNKWTITSAGTYTLTLNVQDLTIDIEKQ